LAEACPLHIGLNALTTRGYISIKKENKCIALETHLQVTDAAKVALLNAGTTFGMQLYRCTNVSFRCFVDFAL
jgi:hypothetical protein